MSDEKIILEIVNKLFKGAENIKVTTKDDLVTATWDEGLLSLPKTELEAIRSGRGIYYGVR